MPENKFLIWLTSGNNLHNDGFWPKIARHTSPWRVSQCNKAHWYESGQTDWCSSTQIGVRSLCQKSEPNQQPAQAVCWWVVFSVRQKPRHKRSQDFWETRSLAFFRSQNPALTLLDSSHSLLFRAYRGPHLHWHPANTSTKYRRGGRWRKGKKERKPSTKRLVKNKEFWGNTQKTKKKIGKCCVKITTRSTEPRRKHAGNPPRLYVLAVCLFTCHNPTQIIGEWGEHLVQLPKSHRTLRTIYC